MIRVSLGMFRREGLERFRRDPRFRRRLLIGVVVALVALGVFGLALNRSGAARERVRAAMADLLSQPSDSELRFIIDVQSDPARVGRAAYHRLHFRAGPGPLLRPAAGPASLQFPFTFVLERRGLALKFRGSYLRRDGGQYLQFSEIPPVGNLPELLLHRWLQLGEKSAETGSGVLDQAVAAVMARHLTARGVLTAVERRGTELVRSVRADVFRLRLDDEKLRALVREAIPQGSGAPHAAVIEFLDRRLELLQIERFDLWVHPRSAAIVRLRLELVPRDAQNLVQRLIVDATVLPRDKVGDVPPVPADATQIRPDIIQRILGVSAGSP